MDRAFNVRDRDILAICRDELGCGILLKVISAEEGNVILIERSDGTGRVRIGKGLVGEVDRIVDLVGIGLEVVDIKEGSLRPVAVESEEGSGEVDLGARG